MALNVNFVFVESVENVVTQHAGFKLVVNIPKTLNKTFKIVVKNAPKKDVSAAKDLSVNYVQMDNAEIVLIKIAFV